MTGFRRATLAQRKSFAKHERPLRSGKNIQFFFAAQKLRNDVDRILVHIGNIIRHIFQDIISVFPSVLIFPFRFL